VFHATLSLSGQRCQDNAVSCCIQSRPRAVSCCIQSRLATALYPAVSRRARKKKSLLFFPGIFFQKKIPVFSIFVTPERHRFSGTFPTPRHNGKSVLVTFG
jgi:hypothetical protein